MTINENNLQIIANNKAYIFNQLHNKEAIKSYADLKKKAKDDIDKMIANDDKLIANPEHNPVYHNNETTGEFAGSVAELVATHVWPCAVKTLNSYFGYRIHPIFHTRKLHTGVDIGCATGTAVYSWNKGKILSYGLNGGYGNEMLVDHGEGITTLYGHLSAPVASVGGFVEAGALIAKSGSTGFSTGPHLHFEVRIKGNPVDPIPYLKGAKANSKLNDPYFQITKK
jgi:murein DD-endopeptidase MepM/ murein hydrolase activator NlpD